METCLIPSFIPLTESDMYV